LSIRLTSLPVSFSETICAACLLNGEGVDVPRSADAPSTVLVAGRLTGTARPASSALRRAHPSTPGVRPLCAADRAKGGQERNPQEDTGPARTELFEPVERCPLLLAPLVVNFSEPLEKVALAALWGRAVHALDQLGGPGEGTGEGRGQAVNSS
jgi:hypothetical protein